MAITAQTLRRLAELSLAPEQMTGVLGIIADIQAREEELEAAEVERKAKDRDRKRHGKSVEIPAPTQGKATEPLPNKETSPVPPKEINPSPVLVNSDTTPVRARGSRLPENFEPDLGEALALGISLDRAVGEAAKFKDHFAAAPGQRGVKLDWPATWRNWCRRAAEDNPRASTGPPKTQSKNGWAELAYDLQERRNDPAASNGFHAPDNPVDRRGNGQAAAPHRVLDAERSAPAGAPRPRTAGH